jgi:hypothetical protein
MTDMLYGHADVKHETHPTAVLNDGGKMMTPKRNKQPQKKLFELVRVFSRLTYNDNGGGHCYLFLAG